jgi:hypothetical protein
MSSELEVIKADIVMTKDELAIAKQKLAEAEGTGVDAKIAKHEAEVERKEKLLTEQQKEKNLLLDRTGNVIYIFLCNSRKTSLLLVYP